MTKYISKADAINTILGDMQNGESNMEEIFNTALRKAASRIDTIPAADVVPVVHAEWKENDNETWSCSRCHSWIPDEQYDYARYCLHCGAKMDKEDNE